MDTEFKQGLWLQFGAAIDSLNAAINRCPDALWTAALWQDPDDPRYGQVWYIIYHTLSWLDLYLLGSYEDFVPPPPFKRGVFPDAPYTQAQLLGYLDACRRKCQSTIAALTDETAHRRCSFDWFEASFFELQLYNMRHVQEHTAQLNLFLGSHNVAVIDWIPQAQDAAP